MKPLPKLRWSSVAVLAGMLLVLSGLVAPAAQAATARSLTVRATPAAAYGGTTVTFSGRVTRSPKGSVVRIQRKTASGWVLARTTRTTNATGSYSVKLARPSAPAVYAYRAFAPKTPRLKAAYSPATRISSLRHTAATITATPASISQGGTSALSGSVSPFVAGTTVSVQRQSGSSWVTVATTPLTASGSFSQSVTPTTTTSYRVVVPRAGLNEGTSSATTTVTVGAATPPPVITTTSLPDADKGVAYSATLAKTGEPGTWTKSAGTLPPGIALTASTGALSGTPTAAGTFNFTVSFSETSTGLSTSKALSIVVTPAPTISTTVLPDATRGSSYTATLAKTGAAGTWSIIGLPAGLSLDPGTGVISGTTSVQTNTYGVYPTFTETSTGRQATKALALKVVGSNVAISTTTLPDATRATPYTTTLTKSGGNGTWEVAGLPSGLTLDGATGVISGVPGAHTGTYGVYVKFTEAGSGVEATKALALNVVGTDVSVTTTSLPDGTKGVPYSATLTKTGAAGTWSMLIDPDDAATTSNLSIDPATGVISGTPTHHGQYAVYVAFTETSTGAVATKALSLDIANSPVITTTSLPDGTTGTAYSQQLTKTGQAGTWTLTSGDLPDGVTLSADGLIAGTPTEPGDFGITVTYTETSTSYFDKQQLLLHVSNPGAPAITTASLPAGTVGTAYNATLETTGTLGTWSVTWGTLPDGLSLNSLTGAITGTPTTAGDSLFQVTYTTIGNFNTKLLGIRIAPTPPG